MINLQGSFFGELKNKVVELEARKLGNFKKDEETWRLRIEKGDLNTFFFP